MRKNSRSVRKHSRVHVLFKSQRHLFHNTCTTYLKLPVRSEAPGLNNTWVKKLAPRLWMREGDRRKKRRSNLGLVPVVIRVSARRVSGNWRHSCWCAVTWWVSCAGPSRIRLRSLGSEYQTPGRNYLPSAFWQKKTKTVLTKGFIMSLPTVFCGTVTKYYVNYLKYGPNKSPKLNQVIRNGNAETLTQ